MTPAAGSKRTDLSGLVPNVPRPCARPSRLRTSHGPGESRASDSAGAGPPEPAPGASPNRDAPATASLGLAPVADHHTSGTDIDAVGGAGDRMRQHRVTPPPALPMPSPEPSWDALVRQAESGMLQPVNLPGNLDRPKTEALALAAAAEAEVACAKGLLRQSLDADPRYQLKLALAACWSGQPAAAQDLAAGLDSANADKMQARLLKIYLDQTLLMARTGNVRALTAACKLTSLRDRCAAHFPFLQRLTAEAVEAGNEGLLTQLLETPRLIVGATAPPSLVSLSGRPQVLVLLECAANNDQGIAFSQIMNANCRAHGGAQSLYREALGTHLDTMEGPGSPFHSRPSFRALLVWSQERKQAPPQPLSMCRARVAANALLAACRGKDGSARTDAVLDAGRHFSKMWREEDRTPGPHPVGFDKSMYYCVLSNALYAAVGCRQKTSVKAMLALMAAEDPPEHKTTLAGATQLAQLGGMLGLAERISQAASTKGVAVHSLTP